MASEVIKLDLQPGQRLRVLSDLHLGHPGTMIQKVEQLNPLLEEVNHLVLAGDTWQPVFEAVRSQSEKILNDLLGECSRKGVQVTLLRGNHDPISEYPMAAYVCGQKYLITHGHAIFREGAPWAKSLRHCQKEVDEYWRDAGPQSDVLEGRLACAHDVAELLLPRADQLKSLFSLLRMPRLRPMLEAWRSFPSESARFLEQYSSRTECIISGHFHRAGDWLIDGKRVINTGAFTRMSKRYAVDICDGEITLNKIVKRAGTFVLQ